jgi:putative SOS response-associated peptidase YedK
MCGRFTLTADDIASLAREWAAEVDRALAQGWRPRFNVAPGDRHPVLVSEQGRRRLISATFGLAGLRPAAAGPLLINVRIETAASRPTFRDAWRTRRTAVPADGFFEWEGPPSARRPTWFHLRGRDPMLLAALLGEAPDGGPGFAVLTREACAPVRALHERMPVLLSPVALDAWLSGKPPAVPEPAGGELVARPVSPRVNSVENDDPACLDAAEDPGQRTLF